jgi:3-dehydroquinate synthetase
VAQGLKRWFPPVALTAASPEAVLAAMRHDKKNSAGRIKLSLLKAIGQAVPEAELPADRALALVGAALDYYRERFGA